MNREPLRPLADEEIESFRRDSVVCLRRLFDPQWVDYLREQGEEDMLRDSGIPPGAPLDCDLFPQVWRRQEAA